MAQTNQVVFQCDWCFVKKTVYPGNKFNNVHTPEGWGMAQITIPSKPDHMVEKMLCENCTRLVIKFVNGRREGVASDGTEGQGEHRA